MKGVGFAGLPLQLPPPSIRPGVALPCVAAPYIVCFSPTIDNLTVHCFFVLLLRAGSAFSSCRPMVSLGAFVDWWLGLPAKTASDALGHALLSAKLIK
jgi:hypothetical protein